MAANYSWEMTQGSEIVLPIKSISIYTTTLSLSPSVIAKRELLSLQPGRVYIVGLKKEPSQNASQS